MATRQQIQERLAEVIQKSGMPHSEIADKLHITQTEVAHYANGEKLPSLVILANLSILLDVDARYILCQ